MEEAHEGNVTPSLSFYLFFPLFCLLVGGFDGWYTDLGDGIPAYYGRPRIRAEGWLWSFALLVGHGVIAWAIFRFDFSYVLMTIAVSIDCWCLGFMGLIWPGLTRANARRLRLIWEWEVGR
jgi:hypothetical protein